MDQILLQQCCAVMLLCVALPELVQCKCPTIVFNFGDSNSDTGGAPAGFGYNMPPPEGRSFFHRPAGRFCDGRLMIDFLCESMNTSYLSPYLESQGSDFKNGANFAISGSSTLPADKPFSLHVQQGQFLHFRSRSLELTKQGVEGLINEDGFRTAIYSIDIGQNDLSGAFGWLRRYDKVIENIPSVIDEIRKAMETIYGSGGRNFWVHGTGPIGCLPQKLALSRHDNDTIDPNGCLVKYNNASLEFNRQLSSLCFELAEKWRDDAVVVYTDIFSIKYDVIANYASYGFENPLMACCGSGGPPYNYDEKLTCGNPKCPVCADGTKFISWDGVHYTEAANQIFANKILTAKYSVPSYKFGYFCRP